MDASQSAWQPLLLLLLLGEATAVSHGVYAPAAAYIEATGGACFVRKDGVTERACVVREGDTLRLKCIISGHPRPKVRWTKTAGSSSIPEVSVHKEMLYISPVLRTHGGRYYCRAYNAIGVPAIRSIRVDVYYLDPPVLTVHQSVVETKEYFYAERTVFLRCSTMANPHARHSWWRNHEALSAATDDGLAIYEPLFIEADVNILKLKNLRHQDFANYSCRVSVCGVCGIPDATISFQLSTTTGPPLVYWPLPEQMVVDPGTRVVLPCVVIGGDPSPSISWDRPAAGLPPGHILSGGNLTLPLVQSYHAGSYHCLVENGVGEPQTRTVQLVVRLLTNGRFWITPDPYHDDDNIKIGREVKISCQVEALPPKELSFSWFKDGHMLQPSDRMIISEKDADFAPGTSSLDIIDLKFTDFGTYTCKARLRSKRVAPLSIDVNISENTVPPSIIEPSDDSPVVVQEGSEAELQCLVYGKPKPLVLWSRTSQSGADRWLEVAGPSGTSLNPDVVEPVAGPMGPWPGEGENGVLRFPNVSHKDAGVYTCRTSHYNGFNVRPRQAQTHLIVLYPPMVEPEFTTVRRGAGRSVMMECRVLQANPSRILTFEWHFRGKVLSAGRLDSPGYVSSHRLPAVAADDYGQYTCTLQNEAGAGTCVFHLTGRALPPEFYFDTPSPVRVQRPWLYSYLLQWTQSSPEAADIITAYHLEVRQVDEGAWHSATVPLSGVVRSGDLFSHSISELIVPLAYDIRLSALTRFGLGETATRHIYYTDVINPQQGDIFCGFEDNKMCGFTQYSTRNTTMNFSWVQLPAAQTNKGAHSHNSGLMVGEKEQLLWSHPRAVPVGVLRLRVRSLSRRDVLLWSSGLRGEDRHWQPISVSFTPHGPFRLVFEAVRGSGTYGRLLVDDISIMEGFCHHAASGAVTSTARSRMAAERSRITILLPVLIVSFTQR